MSQISQIQDADMFDGESPGGTWFPDIFPDLRNADEYLEKLEQRDPNELPQDERMCIICQEQYGSNGNDENFVQFECGHRRVLFELDIRSYEATEVNLESDEEGEMDLSWEVYSEQSFSSEDEEEECYIRELVIMLRGGSLADLRAGIRFVEPILSGDSPIPHGMRYSRQVLVLYRTYFEIFFADPSRAPNDVSILEVKSRLAECCGWLYVLFGQWLRAGNVTPPWNVNGPSIEHLSDPNLHGMIEAGIMLFLRYEKRFGRRLSTSGVGFDS
ncbi:hypothetical protein ACLMJK_001926 [Lecanora helva]